MIQNSELLKIQKQNPFRLSSMTLKTVCLFLAISSQNQRNKQASNRRAFRADYLRNIAHFMPLKSITFLEIFEKLIIFTNNFMAVGKKTVECSSCFDLTFHRFVRRHTIDSTRTLATDRSHAVNLCL